MSTRTARGQLSQVRDYFTGRARDRWWREQAQVSLLKRHLSLVAHSWVSEIEDQVQQLPVHDPSLSYAQQFSRLDATLGTLQPDSSHRLERWLAGLEGQVASMNRRRHAREDDPNG